MRFAIASTEIEGAVVTGEMQVLLDLWARGEIDDGELMRRVLESFGPGR